MRPALYIFDLDGTLVDSAADIGAAVLQVLAEFGAPAGPAALRPCISRPLGEIFAHLAPGASHQAMIARYREVYREICTRTTVPYPGVVETLERLRGAQRSIATTKKSWLARLVVERLGLAAHFDWIQGTDDFPYKPDPGVLLRVLEHFRVPPERALMVGDTPADILCARAAGVPCAAVTYGTATPEELEPFQPQYLLARFPDILHISI